MPTIVTIGTVDDEGADNVAEILRDFDGEEGPPGTRPRRRQVYRYSDLCVHVQDWDADEARALEVSATDPRHRRLTGDLAEHIGEYTARDDWDGPVDQPAASRFYLWRDAGFTDLENTHCAVVVNTQRREHIPAVSALFAELDASDFPPKMGTLRRQLFLYRGVYLHIQDFTTPDGREVIDDAFKESDPRFVQICADLTPIVPPYDAAAGGVAARFYHWTAGREAPRVRQDG